MVAAVKLYFPEYLNSLPKVALELLGWKKGHPGADHVPSPEMVVFAIAKRLLDTGCADIAFGVLLSFDCYLRISDVYHLTESNFVFH